MKKSTIFLIISILVFFIALGIMYFFYQKNLEESKREVSLPEKVLTPQERREEMQNFLNTITPTTTEAIKAAEDNAKQMQSFLDTLNSPQKPVKAASSTVKSSTTTKAVSQ